MNVRPNPINMLQASIILASLLALHSPVAVSGALRSRAVQTASAQTTKDLAEDAVCRTRVLVTEVIAASYPELKGADIRIKLFRSRSDYFKTRFGIPQYFFARMRYLVFVNPRVLAQARAVEPGSDPGDEITETPGSAGIPACLA